MLIDLQNKPDDFVSLHRTAISDPNGRGVVPVLECDDGNTVLAESIVILEYLDDLSPGIETSAEQRARARLFATLFGGRLSSMPILKEELGSEGEAKAVERLRTDLRAMDAFLSATGPGPFLFSEFGYAEAAVAPFAQRLAIVLPGVRPQLSVRAWMEEDQLDRLCGWMDAVCSRSSCVDTLPPPDELVERMQAMAERMKAMAARPA